jgi:glycosyltransferase involved in cell wall biosynthesis
VGSPTAPLRVVLVSHSARLGGAELCLVELAEGLVRFFGADVEVILPTQGPLWDVLVAARARPRLLRHFGWATANAPSLAGAALMALNLGPCLQLAARFRRTRPDIVATNSIVNPAGAYAARLAGVPHIWLVNEYGDLDHGYRFSLGITRSLREVGRLSRRVFTCSRALAARVGKHVPVEKIQVAYYAVTFGIQGPTVSPPGVAGAPKLLILGRKHPGKGQAEAVRALQRVRERGSAATLRLVGEAQGPYERELERLCSEPASDGAAVLVRTVADQIQEIDACDVLLLCSRSEAFGRVLVEAMKRGRPVIAARAGGAEELVTDSGGGLLYPVGDDEALAGAIERLGRDPGEARRLADSGRGWAERNCTLEGYAGAFVDAVRKLRTRAR